MSRQTNSIIRIVFQASDNLASTKAKAAAKKFGTYNESTSGKVTNCEIKIQADNLWEAKELIYFLKYARSKFVYINDKLSDWGNTLTYNNCYFKREDSNTPEKYCYIDEFESINLWGCKNSRLVFGAESTIGKIGKWINKEGDWEFNKKSIKSILNNDLYPFRYCPSLRHNSIDIAINSLPDIVLSNDPDWRKIPYYGKKNQSTLELRDQNSFFPNTIESYLGVEPINNKIIFEIIKKSNKYIPMIQVY